MPYYFCNTFFKKIIIQIFLIIFFTLPTLATEKVEINRLYQALNLKGLFQELQEEGIIAGTEMLKDGGQSQQSQAWVITLKEIYSAESLEEFFKSELLKLNVVEKMVNAINEWRNSFCFSNDFHCYSYFLIFF